MFSRKVTGAWSVAEASALLLRVHRPGGDRVSPCRWSLLGRGGRSGVARALLLRAHRLGGKGLSLRAGGGCSGGVVTVGEARARHAAGSPATRRRTVSSCRWSLLGRGGHWRETRALMLRVHQPLGDGLSLCACGGCQVGVVTEGRPEPSRCGFSGQGETECLSVPVVVAREGWSLRGG